MEYSKMEKIRRLKKEYNDIKNAIARSRTKANLEALKEQALAVKEELNLLTDDNKFSWKL